MIEYQESSLVSTIVHLLASNFVGGPERQILGLARHLMPTYRSVFMTFAENGRGQAFVDHAGKLGLEAISLKKDTPRLLQSIVEIRDRIRCHQAGIVLCHGYKANILGRLATRSLRIPTLAVSRGWTGECLRVKLYESLDRFALRWMDRVICVSQAQATSVTKAGVSPLKIDTISNAIDPDRFECPTPSDRSQLMRYFPRPVRWIIGAAGRLSPEKGFDVLVRAATIARKQNTQLGFILFGDGPCREDLQKQISTAGIADHFVLAGFSSDIDRWLPNCDALALSSHTEGLPNIILEACAAGVPVIATAVGGTPEVIQDGITGFLVSAGDALSLANRICQTVASEKNRFDMGQRGRERVLTHFGFAQQAQQYTALFKSLGCYPSANPIQDSNDSRTASAELSCRP